MFFDKVPTYNLACLDPNMLSLVTNHLAINYYLQIIIRVKPDVVVVKIIKVVKRPLLKNIMLGSQLDHTNSATKRIIFIFSNNHLLLSLCLLCRSCYELNQLSS